MQHAEIGDRIYALEALDCSEGVNEALCYIAFAMFSTLNTLVNKGHLQTSKDAGVSYRPNVTKCQLKTEVLPIVFRQISFKGDGGTGSDMSASSNYLGNGS